MRVLLYVSVFVFAKTGEGVDFESYDDSPFQKKVGSPQFDEPVPFGHITRAGFGDPYSPMKPPLDLLELSMRMPTDKKEALKTLERAKSSNVLFLNANIPSIFGKPSPKEEMIFQRYLNQVRNTNHTLKWYDLPTLQARNAMLPPKHQYIPKKKALPGTPVLPPSPPMVGKQPFLSKYLPELSTERPEESMNWTTCDEFAVGAVFSPKDVVNLKWTPFFIWNDREINVATEHYFQYPTIKLVNEYHLKYGKMLNKTVDWSKTKLLMHGTNEALLIAADRRGLFNVIRKHDVPDSPTPDLKMPAVSLRMKIADPYLVMTYCEVHQALAMAISGNEPTNANEMTAEAATIKFVGKGGPVWRNFEWEKEKIQLEHAAKMRIADGKFIVVNRHMPPVGQWD